LWCRRSLCGTNNFNQKISLYKWIVCVIPLYRTGKSQELNRDHENFYFGEIFEPTKALQSHLYSLPERQGCPPRLSQRLALSLPLLFLHLAGYKDEPPGPRSGALLLERRYRSGSKSPKISFSRGGSVQPCDSVYVWSEPEPGISGSASAGWCHMWSIVRFSKPFGAT